MQTQGLIDMKGQNIPPSTDTETASSTFSNVFIYILIVQSK